MSSGESRTRREILADAAKLAAAASISGLAGCFPSVGGSWPDASTCTNPGTTSAAGVPPAVTPAVVEVFRPESVVNYVIDPAAVATMLDAGLMALANQARMFNAGVSAQGGGANTAEAGAPASDGGTDNPWKVLLPNYQPGQRIGLKVNCLNDHHVTTSPALVGAIVASLHEKLGVDPTTIVVWDRFLADLENSGKYSSDALGGAKLVGNLLRGLNTGESEDDPTITGGHGFDDPICSAPIGVPLPGKTASYPRLSRVLTQEIDLVINCPVFKVHNISGITGAMKNIYGMINIPDQYHDANLATDMPKLYALPDIRNRISLTIFDALIGVVNGQTPADRPDQSPGRLLLAQDPVAIDSYALDLIDQLRALSDAGSRSAAANPWLDGAATLGLGSRSYSLIQV